MTTATRTLNTTQGLILALALVAAFWLAMLAAAWGIFA